MMFSRRGAGRPDVAARLAAVIPTLTFLLGRGNAVAGPAWQAIQPDLVDRSVLPQAAVFNGVGMNLVLAVGPALGGSSSRPPARLGSR